MGRSASSFYAPPTAREIALLLTLLIFLLITSSSLTNSLDSSQFTNYPFLQSPSSTHRSPNPNGTLEPKKFETALSWKNSEKVPDTVIVAHAPGWTIFDRLYALGGTLYIVTDDPTSVPNKKYILSTALRIANGPIESAKRIPTDKELRVISTADAKTLFGSRADVLDGVTVSPAISSQSPVPSLTNCGKWYANDPNQL